MGTEILSIGTSPNPPSQTLDVSTTPWIALGPKRAAKSAAEIVPLLVPITQIGACDCSFRKATTADKSLNMFGPGAEKRAEAAGMIGRRVGNGDRHAGRIETPALAHEERVVHLRERRRRRWKEDHAGRRVGRAR